MNIQKPLHIPTLKEKMGVPDIEAAAKNLKKKLEADKEDERTFKKWQKLNSRLDTSRPTYYN